MFNALVRLVSVPVAGLLLSGCMSLKTPMTDFATDYNRVIADTRNEMILLNILRAQHREPTHYSSVSGIEGSISLSANAGAGYSYIADGIAATESGEVSNMSVGVSIASEPSFTIVPLSSEEFVRGLLSPINSATIALLLSQGWPEYILGPLLVERITCGTTELRNNPDQLGTEGYDLQDFARIRFKTTPAPAPPAYSLTMADSDVAALLLDANAGRFTITAREGEGEGATGRSHVTIQPNSTAQLVTAQLPERLQAACSATAAASIAGDGHYGDAPVLHMRSAEGIIYYLGELLRSGHSSQISGADLPGSSGSSERYLFRLDGRDVPASIAVNFRGRRYAIAQQDGSSPNRALQVISLINQLLALQTSTEALARTPTSVRVR